MNFNTLKCLISKLQNHFVSLHEIKEYSLLSVPHN